MLITVAERRSPSPGQAPLCLGSKDVLFVSCADTCIKLDLIPFLRASCLPSAIFLGIGHLQDEGDVSSKCYFANTCMYLTRNEQQAVQPCLPQLDAGEMHVQVDPALQGLFPLDAQFGFGD